MSGEQAMTLSKNKYTLISAIICLFLLISVTPVRADINIYEFQLIEDEFQIGNRVVIPVRLLDISTGELVPDAIIFANRIDMTPEGRPERDSDLAALPSSEPGIYVFRTNLLEVGNWQLMLVAMLPGITGMVEGRMVLKAVP